MDDLSVQFAHVLFTGQKSRSKKLFDDLLSESERIMFVKRLAIVVLLEKKISHYKIARQLCVSESTVGAIAKKIQNGAFSTLRAEIKKRTFDREKFWNTVDFVLRGGLPPRAGRDRWKYFFSMRD